MTDVPGFVHGVVPLLVVPTVALHDTSF
jgi:hypothetical protein